MAIKKVSLKDIESRAKMNASVRRNLIETFNENIKSKNLNQGRMRPRDPDEEEILAMFEKDNDIK